MSESASDMGSGGRAQGSAHVELNPCKQVWPPSHVPWARQDSDRSAGARRRSDVNVSDGFPPYGVSVL